MSGTLNFAIITIRIIIALLQELAIVQSIIVERNLHAYYKLPKEQTQHLTQEYHILQCPYRNTTAIPTPAEMEICVIVNSYKEEAKNATSTQRIKSPLHTKVKYRMPRKHRVGTKRLAKGSRLHPYTIIFRPIRMGTEPRCLYPPTLQLQQSPHHTEHSGIVKKDNSWAVEQRAALQKPKPPDQRILSTKVSQNIAARVTPITENVEENVESEGAEETQESAEESEVIVESEEANSKPMSDEDFTDSDRYDERSAQYSNGVPNDSVLKYLGTNEAIKELSKRHFRHRPLHAGAHDESSEKYFGEHKNYQRGEKVHGFQNYYHRDEIFNDHIFYDDLQQQGHYANRGRT